MDWAEYEEAKRCRSLDQDLDSDEKLTRRYWVKKIEEDKEEKNWEGWMKMLENIGVDVKEEPVSEVEKQNYYNRNGIEAKDIIRAIYQYYGSDLSSWEAACIYNIVKYLMRYKYKGNAKKDLDKLIVNVNWLKKEI